ncbi:MAG: hypothetical protein NTV51_01420 [Verrucomicrobia bacterium]|nr:hypothetical protein [Verrucomicrobiota bacterium]
MSEYPSLKIALGGDATAVFDAGVPVLAGEMTDNLFATAQSAGRIGGLSLFNTGAWVLGAVSRSPTTGIESCAQRIYTDILRATRGLCLARIWNYVPAINESDGSGLENYRAFCRGRSRAFEECHGRGFEAGVPAASAVGCQSPSLTVAFAACRAAPRHVENPRQVPAYRYPPEHGPRAPSFARATVVADGEETTVFISGTAAILGHATVAADDIGAQLGCTLENLREISLACGLGPGLDRGGRSSRHFKVYLRQAADYPQVAATLAGRLFAPGDRVSYLHADICRRPLLVEIEATLFGIRAGSAWD